MKITVIFGGSIEKVGMPNCEATVRAICDVGKYPENGMFSVDGMPAGLETIVKDGQELTVDYKDAKLGR
jgi:hypothetical protein